MVEQVITAWRRLLAGCWLSHGDWLRERRGAKYLHVCDRCGTVAEILPGQRYKARTRLAGRVVERRPVLRWVSRG